MPLDQTLVLEVLRRCFSGECSDCEERSEKQTLCHYGVRAVEVPKGQYCIHKLKKPGLSYASAGGNQAGNSAER